MGVKPLGVICFIWGVFTVSRSELRSKPMCLNLHTYFIYLLQIFFLNRNSVVSSNFRKENFSDLHNKLPISKHRCSTSSRSLYKVCNTHMNCDDSICDFFPLLPCKIHYIKKKCYFFSDPRF